MINRLTSAPSPRRGDGNSVPDYWVVYTSCEFYYVSPKTARDLLRKLARIWRPRWLDFVDLQGSRVRLRTSRVESLLECTQAQRKTSRAFLEALRNEDKEDRNPWEE